MYTVCITVAYHNKIHEILMSQYPTVQYILTIGHGTSALGLKGVIMLDPGFTSLLSPFPCKSICREKSEHKDTNIDSFCVVRTVRMYVCT